MLCYVMLCDVMVWHVMLWYDMLWYVIVWYVMVRHGMLVMVCYDHVMVHYVMVCDMWCYVMLDDAMLWYGVS